MNIVLYVLAIIVLVIAATLLYKWMHNLFEVRKKELNINEDKSRHVNSK